GPQVVCAGPWERGGRQPEIFLGIGRVENTVRAAQRPLRTRLPCETDTGSEVLPVDVSEVRLAGAALAIASENVCPVQGAGRIGLRGTPRGESVEVLMKRPLHFVPKAEIQCKLRGNFEVVLNECAGIPVDLAEADRLRHSGIVNDPQEEAGECIPRA